MMKAGDILGRSVVVREGGREVGRIRDFVVDEKGKCVLGFVVSEGVLRKTKVAPWRGLQTIGPDAVILSGADSIVGVTAVPEIKAALDSGTRIRGLRLETTLGKELGKLDDFYFDEKTGEILGYQVSGGVLSDHWGGPLLLPLPSSLELGRDVAFIPPEVEATLTTDAEARRTTLETDHAVASSEDRGDAS